MFSYSLKQCFSPTLIVRNFVSALNNLFQMDYEQIVQTINSFQNYNPPFQVIGNKQSMRRDPMKFKMMYEYLARTGVTQNDLDELSIIHITGTKGKGSTSAFCESVLRAHGYRTGFYSSPHLVTIRERIRINGKIMDKERFMLHFSDIYSKLKKTQEHENDMPGYFCFLTVLALNVFLKETVDVVILEVGIGGLLDNTNVVRNVPSIGVSSLGLDHTDILGETIEEIASEKAGIMKPGCTAYTVDQPLNALAVLQSVADEIKCPLHVVPKFDSYEWEDDCRPKLSINLPEYETNASLAIQLAHSWINKHHKTKKIVNGNGIKLNLKPRQNSVLNGSARCNDNGHFEKSDTGVTMFLPKQTAHGLLSCHWPGRFQVFPTDYANFFLDGAHTAESIAACVKWFKDCSRSRSQMLLFNTTGVRNSETLIKFLTTINFRRAMFSPNFATNDIDPKNEQFSLFNKDVQMVRCKQNLALWNEFSSNIIINNDNNFVFENVSDVLVYIKEDFKKTCQKSDVLVTGSLHLIGAILRLLDPTLSTIL